MKNIACLATFLVHFLLFLHFQEEKFLYLTLLRGHTHNDQFFFLSSDLGVVSKN